MKYARFSLKINFQRSCKKHTILFSNVHSSTLLFLAKNNACGTLEGIMDSWMLDLMNRTSLALDLELNCSENLTCITSSVRKIKTDFWEQIFGSRPTQLALLMKKKKIKEKKSNNYRTSSTFQGLSVRIFLLATLYPFSL